MKKLIGKMDLWLLLVMIIFTVFGLVMIFSASSIAAVLRYQTSSIYFIKKQLIVSVATFIFCLIAVIRIPTKYYKILAPIAMALIILLLAGLFLYGSIFNSAQSWYDLGVFKLQPAEFAKSIMILFLGIGYEIVLRFKKKNKYFLFIPLAISAVLAILVAAQPDLGGAIIIAGISFLIFLAVPIDKEMKKNITITFLILGLIAALVLLLFGKSLVNDMQGSRLNFLSPCSRYSDDTGYQVCNGFIAIHNGGLFGVGLGNSTQKYLYLPEAHTDFIFPIICEELGAIVGVGVLLLYGFMLYRILKIAKQADNVRNSLIAYGVFIYLIAHILVNLLGVLALIPLTGVPLPFLSYGGSYAMNVIVMLFIVERIAIENNESAQRKKLENL